MSAESLQPSVNVVPVLAIPFGVVRLPGAEALNASLAERFEAWAAMDRRPQRNALCHHGADDLQDRPEPPVPELVAQMVAGAQAFVRAVHDGPNDPLRALRVETRAWYSIVRPNGHIGTTSYPLTAWCAIYCVQAPPVSEARYDSGVLRLHESRMGTSFADATNTMMRVPFTPGHYTWRPVPGEMAIFPATLQHEVATIRSNGSLIVATMRIRFVGEQQTGMSRW